MKLDESKVIENMQNYLKHIKNESVEESKQALIRIGVLTKSGKRKKSIVTTV